MSNRLRSIAAVFVGFLAVFVLSMGTDQILHEMHFYPAWEKGMHDPIQNLVALAYRCVYTVLGGYIAAKFAPFKPMTHAWVLGGIGTVAALLGFFATRISILVRLGIRSPWSSLRYLVAGWAAFCSKGLRRGVEPGRCAG